MVITKSMSVWRVIDTYLESGVSSALGAWICCLAWEGRTTVRTGGLMKECQSATRHANLVQHLATAREPLQAITVGH